MASIHLREAYVRFESYPLSQTDRGKLSPLTYPYFSRSPMPSNGYELNAS